MELHLYLTDNIDACDNKCREKSFFSYIDPQQYFFSSPLCCNIAMACITWKSYLQSVGLEATLYYVSIYGSYNLCKNMEEIPWKEFRMIGFKPFKMIFLHLSSWGKLWKFKKAIVEILNFLCKWMLNWMQNPTSFK